MGAAIARSIALLVLAFALIAPCTLQAQVASPVPAAVCAQPNALAHVVNAVAPKTPALAAQAHVSGDVVVEITLDDRSQLVAASIVKTASALLNDAALTAARASTYQTAIRNCTSQGGRYRFIVEFVDYSGEPGSEFPFLAFFSGSWNCSTPGGSPFPRAYAFRNGIVSTIGKPETGSDRIDALVLLGEQLQLFGSLADGSSYAVTAAAARDRTQYVFTGKTARALPAGNVDIRVTLVETDPTHYRWISEIGPDRDGAFVVKTTEDCTRSVATR